MDKFNLQLLISNGIDTNMLASDLIHNGVWNIPPDWITLIPSLISIISQFSPSIFLDIMVSPAAADGNLTMKI